MDLTGRIDNRESTHSSEGLHCVPFHNMIICILDEFCANEHAELSN